MMELTFENPITCELYDPVDCGADSKGCNSTVQCDIPEKGKRTHCYALWTNQSGVFELQKKVGSGPDTSILFIVFMR